MKNDELTLSEKILQICREHGSLSSKQIHTKLKEEFREAPSVRTVQKYVSELCSQGKLNFSTVGREQFYSIQKSSQKQVAMTDYFINQFWKELFRIRSEAYSQHYEKALQDLLSLINMLPSSMKDTIEKEKPNLGKKAQQKLEEIYGKPGGKPNLFMRMELETQILVDVLIDRISTLLHEEFEKLQKDNREKQL